MFAHCHADIPTFTRTEQTSKTKVTKHLVLRTGIVQAQYSYRTEDGVLYTLYTVTGTTVQLARKMQT
jgi:hypothetical protein